MEFSVRRLKNLERDTIGAEKYCLKKNLPGNCLSIPGPIPLIIASGFPCFPIDRSFFHRS